MSSSADAITHADYFDVVDEECPDCEGSGEVALHRRGGTHWRECCRCHGVGCIPSAETLAREAAERDAAHADLMRKGGDLFTRIVARVGWRGPDGVDDDDAGDER
jgi:hypothetical protein